MYILFLDESGSPPKPECTGEKYFCIGAVIVPEGVWHALAEELEAVKKRYGVFGEIKWKWFAGKNMKGENPLLHLDNTKRDELRRDIFRILTSRKAVTLLASVCCVEAAYEMASVKSTSQLYNLTYKAVTERFQYFLQDLERTNGRKELGIVVADARNGPEDNVLRHHHNQLLANPSEWTSKYKHMVETLFFTPSHLSVGIQFADLVAGAVRFYFEKGDPKFVTMIKDSFRKSADGRVDGFGLVKVPKKTFR